MKMHICYETEIAGFEIVLLQGSDKRFSVRYGKQLDSNLTYARAAAKLGEAIMHATACEGQLDNRGP